jgi:hypothetical protein
MISFVLDINTPSDFYEMTIAIIMFLVLSRQLHKWKLACPTDICRSDEKALLYPVPEKLNMIMLLTAL